MHLCRSELQCAHPGCKGEEQVWTRRARTGEGPTTWVWLHLSPANSKSWQDDIPRHGVSSFQFREGEKTTRQGLYGVGSAVKESIRRQASYTREFIDEHLRQTRYELAGKYEAFNFIVAYAPTEGTKDA